MASSCIFVSVVTLVFIGFGDACHTGWSRHGTMCYKVTSDRENWVDAQRMCEQFGGTLAEIGTSSVQTFLTRRIKSDNKTAAYWIGMTDAENEGTWQWIKSKSILSTNSYTHWGQSQPSTGSYDQNCVLMNANSNGQWYDGHCHRAKGYICQMDSGTGSSILG